MWGKLRLGLGCRWRRYIMWPLQCLTGRRPCIGGSDNKRRTEKDQSCVLRMEQGLSQTAPVTLCSVDLHTTGWSCTHQCWHRLLLQVLLESSLRRSG